MAVITLGAIIAGLGAAISAVLSLSSFIGELIFVPFKVFEGHKILAYIMYWCIIFIDTFIVAGITGSLFKALGVDNFSLNFTDIFLFPINVFLGMIFGFSITSFHVLLILSAILLLSLFLEIKKMQNR